MPHLQYSIIAMHFASEASKHASILYLDAGCRIRTLNAEACVLCMPDAIEAISLAAVFAAQRSLLLAARAPTPGNEQVRIMHFTKHSENAAYPVCQ